MISPQYAAGFFDGEGCVSITVRGKWRQVSLRVTIVNTEAAILSAFHVQWGGSIPRPRTSLTAETRGWKPFRQWVLNGHAAMAFLSEIRPYLRLKCGQVDLAFEFWEFMQQPKSARCEIIPTPSASAPWHVNLRRTNETVVKELDFKTRMHMLNKKGRGR